MEVAVLILLSLAFVGLVKGLCFFFLNSSHFTWLPKRNWQI